MYRKNEKGFTLIEILIAVALLAIISAVVIPNVTGYLGRGESAAYKGDLRLIQSAVDGYYADPANRLTGKKTYPLKGTTAEKISGGTPAGNGTIWTSGTGYFINFTTLVTAKLITDVPASASADNTGGVSGSYSWFVKSDGKVDAALASSFSTTTTGFVDGVYP
ncbi:MAG: prepilin-type N-terminal cleavage/methylation domain-containing protein [Dehalococcoidia bacterium]|nr:prepilin-type N-terminal cleavage/methylation domain-containing protein [Dehalococcoidia bacterium]